MWQSQEKRKRAVPQNKGSRHSRRSALEEWVSEFLSSTRVLLDNNTQRLLTGPTSPLSPLARAPTPADHAAQGKEFRHGRALARAHRLWPRQWAQHCSSWGQQAAQYTARHTARVGSGRGFPAAQPAALGSTAPPTRAPARPLAPQVSGDPRRPAEVKTYQRRKVEDTPPDLYLLASAVLCKCLVLLCWRPGGLVVARHPLRHARRRTWHTCALALH